MPETKEQLEQLLLDKQNAHFDCLEEAEELQEEIEQLESRIQAMETHLVIHDGTKS